MKSSVSASLVKGGVWEGGKRKERRRRRRKKEEKEEDEKGGKDLISAHTPMCGASGTVGRGHFFAHKIYVARCTSGISNTATHKSLLQAVHTQRAVTAFTPATELLRKPLAEDNPLSIAQLFFLWRFMIVMMCADSISFIFV